MRAPTGEQFSLEFQGRTSTSATITALAAGIRTLTVDRVNLTEPFGENESPARGNGIVLMPWPNRVLEGKWMLDGQEQQLDLTEPSAGNAIHGLLRNTEYWPVRRDPASVQLVGTVYPQHGYPFHLRTTVTYEAVDGGLTVTHRIRNESASPAPVAVGAHPYLRVGEEPLEELTLRVCAGSRFDDHEPGQRGGQPVDGSPFDLREGVRVGGLELDTTLGDLQTVDGVARHRLQAPDGRYTELWQDENFPYVQVFTSRVYPRPSGPSLAVAVEPMTAPPNALRSGTSLRWLQPNELWELRWGIRAGHDG